MATYTKHYNLKKPDTSENYNVEDANSNNDIVDETLFSKQDKIPNKGLSTNDFTDEYKKKLDSLNNYDDTDIKDGIKNVVGRTETLEEDNKTNKEDISNLKKQDISQNKLIEQLQKRNALLESQIPTGTASGENITIKDSANMPFKEISVSGNDYQETREGYNLLIPPATQTKNGITFTVNDDNSITVNGTATANASINFVDLSGSPKLSFEAGTYKLTGCPKGGSDTTYRLGNNINTGNAFDIGNGVTVTISTDMTNRNVWLVIYSGTTVNNLTFYPMLRKVTGEEDKPYEQYGAMPSIDYPSEVRACGDNINFLTINQKSQKMNGLDFIINTNGSIIINGTSTAKTTLYFNPDILKLKAGNYFLGNGTTDIMLGFQIDNTYYNTNGNRVITLQDTTNNKFMQSYIQIESGKTIDNVTIYPMIKKGSSALYSPPGQGNMTILKSGNILPIDETSWEQGGINSNAGYNESNTKRLRTKGYIEIEDGTKDLYCYTDTEYCFVNIHAYKKDGTWIKGYYSIDNSINGASEKKINFNNAEIKKIRVVLKKKDETTILPSDITKINPVICENERIKYIVPTQQPFYEGDTFVKVDGVRYEKHYFKRYILNGTENINTWYILDNGGYGFYFYKGDIVSYSNWIMSDLKCNAFKILRGSDINNSTFSKPCMSTWEKNILGKIPIETIGGTSENTRDELKALLKTWLAEQHSNGTPIYIVYPLAEPIFIPCTDDQNAILDEIEQDENYKNITHIYSEDEISPTFNVEYYKDLETMFNNLNTAIVSLGGV